MRYIALFAGVAPHTKEFEKLGWECVAFSEIEAFPSAVLAYHFPHIPNLGDIRKITEAQIKSLGHVDAVLFGFPCQDLSVAGKRAGLKTTDGKHTRSGLFFEAMRIVRISGARFGIGENVPGLFSSNGGRDFAAVVGEMAGVDFDVPDGGWADSGVAIGPEGLVEWCVLDAQFFGLAQRRRRVFIIRDSGNWRSRPPVLFERESLSGNPAPSREKGQDIAGTVGARASSGGGFSTDFETAGGLQAVPELARCLSTSNERIDWETETFVATLGHSQSNGLGVYESDVANTLEAVGSSNQAIAFSAKDHGADASEEVSPTLRAGGFDKSHANSGNWMGVAFSVAPGNCQTPDGQDDIFVSRIDVGRTLDCTCADPTRKQGGTAIMQQMAVRRLTPRECEKLQGMEPDFTLIPYKGKPAADGPRYKAIGNSWAVPVLTWIAKRINRVEEQEA